MGISANQARFLSLTSRQCDLEYRMQQLSQRRMRLANSMQDAASKYNDLTSNRKMFLNLTSDSLTTSSTGQKAVSVEGLGDEGYYIWDSSTKQIIGTYGSGSVFEVNNTADGLKNLQLALSAKNNNANTVIIMDGDVDLSSANFSTVSNFTGTIYGNNHQITTNTELFDTLGTTAKIYDLNVAAATGTTLNANCGLLASQNSGTIQNVAVSGSVTANGNNAAGLVSNNKGTISNVSSTVNVNGTNYSGTAGIVSINSHDISNLSYSGTVSGTNAAGIASTNSATITNAYVQNSTITGTSAAGIASTNSGTLKSTYTDTTTVTGTSAAGIASTNTGTIDTAEAYNTTVSGNSSAGIASTNSGTIQNVAVSGNIGSGADTKVGGVVSVNASGATITNAAANVTIASTGDYNGGIASDNKGTINTASFGGTVGTGAFQGSYLGGIAATNEGTISNAITASTSVLAGKEYLGGIAATNSRTISGSTSVSTIAGSDSGAIAATNSGTIKDSLAAGTSGTGSANYNNGGIVSTNAASGTISDTYTFASVAGTNAASVASTNAGTIGADVSYISGSTGQTSSVFTNSGTDNSKDLKYVTTETISGLDGRLSPSAWDSTQNAEKLPVPNDSTGKTVAINATAGAPLSVTKQITSVTSSDVIILNNNSGLSGENLDMYNRLVAVRASNTNLTGANIITYKAAVPDGNGGYVQKDIVSLEIDNASQLQGVDAACTAGTATAQAMKSNYLLMNDVSLTGPDNWTSIGGLSSAYTGMFDGNGKTVDGLNIQQASSDNNTFQGMFGNVGIGGSVVRTNLTNETISLAGNATNALNTIDSTLFSYKPGYVGGLAGLNDGTIDNCNVGATISITGQANQVGGLVGASGLNRVVYNNGTPLDKTKYAAVMGVDPSMTDADWKATLNQLAIVNKCSTSGSLTVSGNTGSNSEIGGLAGWILGGNTTYSSTSMKLNINNGSDSYIAPMFGDVDSNNSIKYCYATNTVTLGASVQDYSTTGMANGVNNAVISDSYYRPNKTGDYYYYSDSPSSYETGSTPTFAGVPSSGATTTITNPDGSTSNVKVWNADGTLNNAASNTISYQETTYNVTGATAAAPTVAQQTIPATTSLTPTQAKNINDAEFTGKIYSNQTYDPTQTGASNYESLEDGLRDGRYQLVKIADQLTQNPISADNVTDGTQYEKVDWRTSTIISDQLDTSDDEEAQTTYDKTVRDVNSQDKLLELESENINTEYTAVTTEKDAVKKILETNAQGSFKYFS